MKFRLLGLLLLMLMACGQPGLGQGAPSRVIVSFSNTVPLDDSQLLARLSVAAKGRVVFAAAVSPKVAAYFLYCSSEDSRCVRAMAGLRNVAGVTNVAADRKETAQ